LKEFDGHDGSPAAVPLTRASGLVVGWYKRGTKELETKLRKQWKQFRGENPFWTEDAAG
jgi:hypothetical protein